MDSLLYAVVYILILCIVQAILFKSKHFIVQLLPMGVVLLVYVLAILIFIVDLILNRGGVANGTTLALTMAGVNTAALVADCILWLTRRS